MQFLNPGYFEIASLDRHSTSFTQTEVDEVISKK